MIDYKMPNYDESSPVRKAISAISQFEKSRRRVRRSRSFFVFRCGCLSSSCSSSIPPAHIKIAGGTSTRAWRTAIVFTGPARTAGLPRRAARRGCESTRRPAPSRPSLRHPTRAQQRTRWCAALSSTQVTGKRRARGATCATTRGFTSMMTAHPRFVFPHFRRVPARCLPLSRCPSMRLTTAP